MITKTALGATTSFLLSLLAVALVGLASLRASMQCDAFLVSAGAGAKVASRVVKLNAPTITTSSLVVDLSGIGLVTSSTTPSSTTTPSTRPVVTSLYAVRKQGPSSSRSSKTKNKRGSTTSSRKKQQVQTPPDKNNPLQLFVLYMTPWRNPNSIFVYMFLTLYLLGEYSEAKKIAATAAASSSL